MRRKVHWLAAIVSIGTATIGTGCSTGSGGRGSGSSTAIAPATSATPASTTSATTAPVPSAAVLVAGASEIDVTPPIGVPLAGYGGGARRSWIPNLKPSAYNRLLAPSTGVRDPIHAKALFLSDGKEKVCFVTLDAIATEADVVETAWLKAKALGATVPLENLMVCSSHTHSGPGCLTKRTFWALLAADLYHDKVFQDFTAGVARAIVEAERNAEPALAGVETTQIAGATRNRRDGVSPNVTTTSVDPEALVLRVDRAKDGLAIATLWNFSVHGTALGTDSHVFSADIMGGASERIEAGHGGVALFVNGAEGDIAPTFGGDAGIRSGGQIIADQILATRARARTTGALELASVSEKVDLGQPVLDLTLGRAAPLMGSLAQQGWFQVLAQLGASLGVQLNVPAGWLEREFRFQQVRLGKWGFAALPGEPIHDIGVDLKQKGAALGYERLFPCGLANGHASYVATEREYHVGGYEGIATFFGPKTADKLTDAVVRQMMKVKP